MRTVCDDLYTVRRAADDVIVLRWKVIHSEDEARCIMRNARRDGRVTVGRYPDSTEDEARCVVLGETFIREHRLTFREAA